MMTFAALVTITLAPSQVATRAVIPVRTAPAETGRVVDVEGPWIAALQLLLIPEELRRFHAPRRSWELAYLAVDGFDRVVLASEPAGRRARGAPSFAGSPGGQSTIRALGSRWNSA